MGPQSLIAWNSVIHFYTWSFLAFLALVFTIFWILPARFRAAFLLLASFVFYGSWDYRFIPLILFSTIAAYASGLLIRLRPERARLWLWIGVVTNLLQLAVFKYFDFFLDSVRMVGKAAGVSAPSLVWEIALPIGISFYTFQAISYVVDVYWKKIEPTRDFIRFSLYLAFFPQLIAGPIARGGQLLPQLDFTQRLRQIPFAEAAYLFVWGYCKKRIFADQLHPTVSYIYDNPDATGAQILVAFLGFTIQSYCDISGYADMARGSALLFGIRLPLNFNFPFFAANPVEFWKRWHISLSMWVRHYVYIPLLTRLRWPALVILLTFMVMGIWHGPRWHYVHWGIYWGMVSVLYQYLISKNSPWLYLRRYLPWLGSISMALVIYVGQSFFRANSVPYYFDMVRRSGLGFAISDFNRSLMYPVYVIALVLLAYEWLMWRRKNELLVVKKGMYWQIAFYVTVFFLYRNLGGTAYVDFIYFQF